MKVVNTLKRIEMLESARSRAFSFARRHPETDIDYEILDKLVELKESLYRWSHTGANPIDRNRRKQIRLASKLLRKHA